jgi:methylglyoxal synthase
MNGHFLFSSPRKRIALVAHERREQDLLDWAKYNRDLLRRHELCATGAAGAQLAAALGTPVLQLHSGPLGGDQQIGARIAEGMIDFMVFFWDPLEPQPHDPDVKALLRIAVVWNVPVACNRASADFMVTSPLMAGPYQRMLSHMDEYCLGDLAGNELPGPLSLDRP